ncbi:MAG: DUF116 domain-containing protein [Thermoplasmatales archaeon]|nr:DUF116 domain-containing protein [Thermoplasmatales archaeon]
MSIVKDVVKAGAKIPKKAVESGLEIAGMVSSRIDGHLIKRLLELGVDLSTRAGVKSALTLVGKDTTFADDVFIELKNNLNREGFRKTKYNERALFLPQCLRNAEKCKGKMTDAGWVCAECGNCQIYPIKKEAEKLGYRVYVVPGGSMVIKIVKNNGFKAAAGVGCRFELCEAAEKLGSTKIWVQGVPLLRDGCKDTEVDVNRVMGMIQQKE